MTWGPFLFALFILVFFCVAIPAAVAAYWCWTNSRHSDEALRAFALVLGAVSLECICRLVATSFGFIGPRPVYSIGYAITYWTGQAVLAYALVQLVKVLMDGGRPK